MLGVCQRVAGHPDEASRSGRDPVPRTRRDRRSAASPARARVGSRCGIEPCCCSSTTPGRGRKKSPTCASDTSTSVHTHSCACTARATSGAPARCGTRPHGCCTTCWTRPRHHRRRSRRCSPPTGRPLTRFGIYKIVRRHASTLDNPHINRRVSPHTFRHSCAVHLLEAGVEVNVIRGWLGHADLSTTNRYAEINTKTKLAALRACEPPTTSVGDRNTPIWRSDQTLLQLARVTLTVMCPISTHRQAPVTISGDRAHNTAGHITRTT